MPPIKTELLDELLAGVSSPDDLLGDGGVYRQLKKALMERALGAELTHHLGYEKGAAPAGRARGNSRNGRTGKTVLTDDGQNAAWKVRIDWGRSVRSATANRCAPRPPNYGWPASD